VLCVKRKNAWNVRAMQAKCKHALNHLCTHTHTLAHTYTYTNNATVCLCECLSHLTLLTYNAPMRTRLLHALETFRF